MSPTSRLSPRLLLLLALLLCLGLRLPFVSVPYFNLDELVSALVADLARTSPRWIVDTYARDPRFFGPVSLDHLPAFKAQLLQGYVLDTVFPGEYGKVPVYRRE